MNTTLLVTALCFSQVPNIWVDEKPKQSINEDWFKDALQRYYSEPKQAVITASQKNDMARRIDHIKYQVKKYKSQLTSATDARYRQALINTIQAKQKEQLNLEQSLTDGQYIKSYHQHQQVRPARPKTVTPLKSYQGAITHDWGQSRAFWSTPTIGRGWAGSSVSNTLCPT